MFPKNTFNSYLIVLAMCFGAIGLHSCKQKPLTNMIVMTQNKGDVESRDYSKGDKLQYMSGSRIVALNTTTPNEPLDELTSDFYSACSPKISYDGNFMLFAAQKNQDDVWQIWELNLHNKKKKQITSSDHNCIDPDYLPGERLVFSKEVKNKDPKVDTEFTLFSCNLDGSNLAQVTYDPSTYFASTVLSEGRVIAIGKEMWPEKKPANFMIMRPDGTKKELFYQMEQDHYITSGATEMNNGRILFVEANSNNQKDLISLSYNRPLHSEENLTSEIKGDFHAISPYHDNKVLSSYRPENALHFALYEFDVESRELGRPIYEDRENNILEAVFVQKKQRPRKLPSEVDLNVKTALLVCQDINFQYSQPTDSTIPAFKASKMEVLGIDSTMAVFKTEKDGSFYIKIQADTPFRLQTLDDNNNVVKGPSSWMYLRPNERRGCIGCHENRELVPGNVQPLAVTKEPIPVPTPKQMDAPKRELKM